MLMTQWAGPFTATLPKNMGYFGLLEFSKFRLQDCDITTSNKEKILKSMNSKIKYNV